MAFGPYFARGCVFVRDQEAKTYGLISPYDNDVVHRGDAVSTHVASLIFEGQARAMHRLGWNNQATPPKQKHARQ